MTAKSTTAGGRHRGEHRDPVGAVLTGVWALGHVVTVFLLGASAAHQLGSDHLGSTQAAQPASELEPEA